MPDEIVNPQELPDRTRPVYSTGAPSGPFNSSLSDMLGLTIVDPRLLTTMEASARQRQAQQFSDYERTKQQDFLREQATEAEARAGRVRERKRAGLEDFLTSQAPALKPVLPSLFQPQERTGAMAEPEAAGIQPPDVANVPEGSEDLLTHVVSGAYGTLAAQAIKGDEFTRALKKAGYKNEDDFRNRRQEIADMFRRYEDPATAGMADVVEHLDNPTELQRFAARAAENRQKHEQKTQEIDTRLNKQQQNTLERLPVIFGYKERLARLQQDLRTKGVVDHDALRALQSDVSAEGQRLRAAQSEHARLSSDVMFMVGPNKQRVEQRIAQVAKDINDHTAQLDKLQENLRKFYDSSQKSEPSPPPVPDRDTRRKITKGQAERLRQSGKSEAYIERFYDVQGD